MRSENTFHSRGGTNIGPEYDGIRIDLFKSIIFVRTEILSQILDLSESYKICANIL